MHPFPLRCRRANATFYLLLDFVVRIGLSNALRNVTIDDQTGDELTGIVPTYSPLGTENGDWVQGSTCTGCFVNPDASKAYGGTWHDATHQVGASQRIAQIFFKGTAVYAYFICANTIPNATTLTNMTFSLDGDQVGTFERIPESTSNFEYNVPGYVNSNLSDGYHELLIQTAGDVNASLILFDYLIYTIPDPSPSEVGSETTSSKAPESTISNSSDNFKGTSGSRDMGPIVGVVVGAAAVAVITVLALIHRKRKVRDRMHFGDKQKVRIDEDSCDYSTHNTATPLPLTTSQRSYIDLAGPHMVKPQRPITFPEHSRPARPITVSSSLAVQIPDESNADVSSVSGPSGAMPKSKDIQTDIVRKVEEMQQELALRSQMTAVRAAGRHRNPETEARTVSGSEAKMRIHMAALYAEAERLQCQQICFQQQGWVAGPPPQYSEGSES